MENITEQKEKTIWDTLVDYTLVSLCVLGAMILLNQSSYSPLKSKFTIPVFTFIAFLMFVVSDFRTADAKNEIFDQKRTWAYGIFIILLGLVVGLALATMSNFVTDSKYLTLSKSLIGSVILTVATVYPIRQNKDIMFVLSGTTAFFSLFYLGSGTATFILSPLLGGLYALFLCHPITINKRLAEEYKKYCAIAYPGLLVVVGACILSSIGISLTASFVMILSICIGLYAAKRISFQIPIQIVVGVWIASMGTMLAQNIF